MLGETIIDRYADSELGEVVMTGPLMLVRDAIGDLCRRYGVRRLVVFRSALSDRFDESASDVDFLDEFDDSLPSRFEAFFGLKEAFEALLGHPGRPGRAGDSGEPVLHCVRHQDGRGTVCGLTGAVRCASRCGITTGVGASGPQSSTHDGIAHLSCQRVQGG